MLAPLISVLVAVHWTGADPHRRVPPAVDGFLTGNQVPDSPPNSRVAEFGVDQTQPAGLSRSNTGGRSSSPIVFLSTPPTAPDLPDLILTASFTWSAHSERPGPATEPIFLQTSTLAGTCAQNPDNNLSVQTAFRDSPVRSAPAQTPVNNPESPRWPTTGRWQVPNSWLPLFCPSYHCNGLSFQLCAYVALFAGVLPALRTTR